MRAFKMMPQFLTSLFLLTFGFATIGKAEIPDTLRLNRWLEKSKNLFYSDPAGAMQICDSMVELAEAKGLDLYTGRALSRKGVVFWSLGQLDSSLVYEERALGIFSDLHKELDIAKSQNNIGLYAFDALDFETALKSYMGALEYFERTQNLNYLSTVYNNIANVHNRLKHLEIAQEYYEKAGEVFRKIGSDDGVAMVNTNIGLLWRERKQEDSALAFFIRAQNGFAQSGNQLNEAKTLINLGTSRIRNGDTLGGQADFERSLKLATQLRNPAETGTAFLKLSHLELMLRHPEKAISLAREGLRLADSVNYFIAATTLHQILSEAHYMQEAYDSAFYHLDIAFEAKDSIFSQEAQKSIAELEIKYKTQLKENEIEILRARNELGTIRTFWLLSLAAALLLVAVLIYLRQRAIVARETRLKEAAQKTRLAEKALAEAEIKNAESEKKRLTAELEYKGRELSNLALHIVQKNELLERLNAEIRDLRSESSNSDGQKLKNLSLFTNQMLSLEKDREEFQIFIQEANQNFFASLEDQFPKLTPRDRRLCAMIKLGYSSKEISSILNIETSSVEVSRYRLRKKLGIEKSINLQDFLNQVA